jgi:hypothetical protein
MVDNPTQDVGLDQRDISLLDTFTMMTVLLARNRRGVHLPFACQLSKVLFGLPYPLPMPLIGLLTDPKRNQTTPIACGHPPALVA